MIYKPRKKLWLPETASSLWRETDGGVLQHIQDGCDPCGCDETGTGTIGTGTGTGTIASNCGGHCITGTVSEFYLVEVSGITNDVCGSCGSLNKNYIMGEVTPISGGSPPSVLLCGVDVDFPVVCDDADCFGPVTGRLLFDTASLTISGSGGFMRFGFTLSGLNASMNWLSSVFAAPKDCQVSGLSCSPTQSSNCSSPAGRKACINAGSTCLITAL